MDTDSLQSANYDLCKFCGGRIVRDVLMSVSDTGTSYWLGACACPVRKWRWRSPTGDTPWELIA